MRDLETVQEECCHDLGAGGVVALAELLTLQAEEPGEEP